MTPILHLYNTRTKSVEPFSSIHNNEVRIYTCGPTVYHSAHIGNLRAFIFADVLQRVFKTLNYKVTHVINITDVGHMTSDGDTGEDKLEKGARREGKNVWEVAKMYTDAYFEDLRNLNIPLEHYIFPRATDHIREQIALVHALEIAGHTYRISDGIYFDTSTFPTYGDFAHLDIEGLKSGARVEENVEKRNITDFALWKFSKEGEIRQMEWDSPWGKGFPGWHIECSAMAMKYLGEHFDIHTGGIDLIPVHHTNEIAQSECVTGERYVNYWMHVNFLHDRAGNKMSKSSSDGFLTLSSLIEKGYDPSIYRYLTLTTHYRKELSFSYEALDGATVAYKKLKAFVDRNKDKEGVLLETYVTLFKEALYNDINTPEAIAVMWKMIHDKEAKEEDIATTLLYMSTTLGLALEKEETISTLPEEIIALLEKRLGARNKKDFTLSDTLRDQLQEKGYLVKDTKDGQEVVKM